jgi:hypothetical protein
MFEESTRSSNAAALRRRQSTWQKIRPYIKEAVIAMLSLGGICAGLIVVCIAIGG